MTDIILDPSISTTNSCTLTVFHFLRNKLGRRNLMLGTVTVMGLLSRVLLQGQCFSMHRMKTHIPLTRHFVTSNAFTPVVDGGAWVQSIRGPNRPSGIA